MLLGKNLTGQLIPVSYNLVQISLRYLSRKIADIDEGDPSKPAFSKQAQKTTKSILKAKGVSNSNRGPLVQATISTLFKKVENKVGETIEKGSSAEGKRTGRKTTRQEGETETEDDIEEFSSSSQDTDASDEDFAE
ncbi:hypothetical protein Leryth_001367 [Lithospermum erythrorhizon]|nr:hypothetical protein Leryth_001367 [Lithospermum erythrorhizon]